MIAMFSRRIRDGVDLKLLEERHAEAAFAVVDRNRAYLREWLPWVDPTTSPEDTRAFIKTTLQQFANNEGFAAGIWCDGEYIGTIGFHKVDWLNRKVELGYWLAEAFQGRGIITDACRAMIDYAFDEWKLNRVEIHCAPANTKSCAIPRRLGFQLEGTLREGQLLNGKGVDTCVFGMLAREWKKSS